MIVFFKVKLEKTRAEDVKLRLQEEEVEAACWIDQRQIKEVLEKTASEEEVIEVVKSLKEDEEVKLKQLNPFYPNEYGEGFGKALAFAMRYLISLR